MNSRLARFGPKTMTTALTQLAALAPVLRDAAMPPQLPVGRMVRLGDRGETFVRDCPGPADSLPVVLLHGWTLTADVNFVGMFGPLSEHHRVIAPDVRMHGRGPRNRPFTIADAADDVVALLDELKIDRAIVYGYSMGGAIAAELATKHPDRVAGVVITATAAYYSRRRDRLLVGTINALSLLVSCGINPRPAGLLLIPALWGTDLSPERRRWMRKQVAQNSLKDILSVSSFASDYHFEPASVRRPLPPVEFIVLSRDRLCHPPLQRQLAEMLDANVSQLPAHHGIALTNPERFAAASVEAICRLDDRHQHRRPA